MEVGTEALKWDLIGITVSIGFTTFPFSRNYDKTMAAVETTAFYIIAQVGIVSWMFSGHRGLDTPVGKSELPRNALMVIQWFDTSMRVGKTMGWGAGWIAATTAYIGAFTLAGPVTASHMEEPVYERYFPWHRKRVNSLHEDFHAILLVADIMMVRLALIALGGW